MAASSERLSSRTNQYLGVNAHLHSHFLHVEPEGWEEFHSSHITDLTRGMNVLLPEMGYIARQERSLQIRYFDDTVSSPISDVLISDLPQRGTFEPLREAQTKTAFNLPAATLLKPDPTDVKHPFAIKIYEIDGQREKPVAWIELLSPANKHGSGLSAYVAKREALLANWLVFVELDYLHGVSTTLEMIADYRPAGRGQKPSEDAHPYHVWMIDPRLPADDPFSAALAAFDVDAPIPSLNIPLNRGDHLNFDFNAVYHQTFRAQPAFGLVVNYAAPPPAVDRDYNLRDQMAIAARMLTVQKLRHNLPKIASAVEQEIVDRLKSDSSLLDRVLHPA